MLNARQVKAAIPYLRESKGRIIFTSSGAAVKNFASWGAYGASKAALNHLAKTIAEEEPDIVSLCVRPGVVDTEMQKQIREIHSENMDQKEVEYFTQLKADGSLLEASQPGNAIAKLVISAPLALTGQFLR
jgi:NAD(P)-dependent dehydrogenase (short-subunit alcohol dehydrogenase family)